MRTEDLPSSRCEFFFLKFRANALVDRVDLFRTIPLRLDGNDIRAS